MVKRWNKERSHTEELCRLFRLHESTGGDEGISPHATPQEQREFLQSDEGTFFSSTGIDQGTFTRNFKSVAKKYVEANPPRSEGGE